MRITFISLLLLLLFVLGACKQKSGNTNDSGFVKNIQFNHLFVVLDDSTYNYLFDSLPFLSRFSRNNEETVNAGNESWTGKYLYGVSSYLEIFKRSSSRGHKEGAVGLGFITNKLGTIDSLQQYWATTLDSVQVDHRVITDSGKTTPWFTSVSIPNTDSLQVSAWVMENAKEEMYFAGFTEQDLQGEIKFSDYLKHIRARMRKVPIDSVTNDILFDKVTSLDLQLSAKELAYLRQFLLGIGFTEKNHSFSKEDFSITYTVTEAKHFLLQKIHFSLLKRVSKEKHRFRSVSIEADGYQATLYFTYN